MSTSIDQAFVKQFEREVHEAYQRQGSKLRGTVRVKTGVVGSATVFQRVGTASAQTKGRHAMVPVRPMEYTSVEVLAASTSMSASGSTGSTSSRPTSTSARCWPTPVPSRWGARPTSSSSRRSLARAQDASATARTGLTKAKVLQAFEELGADDVPDDGQRYAVIGWRQWSDLLDLQEFASAEFVGDDQLPWRGIQAKRWLGTTWLPHSGLPLSGGVRTCFWYHRARSAMPSARRSPATSPGTATAPRTSSPTRCRRVRA